MTYPSVAFASTDGVPVARILGEVDIAGVGDVEQTLVGIDLQDAAGLVVDLSDCSYVDSSGVRLLFALRERLTARRRRLAVVAPPGSLPRRVLELVDFTRGAPLAASLDEALQSVRGDGA